MEGCWCVHVQYMHLSSRVVNSFSENIFRWHPWKPTHPSDARGGQGRRPSQTSRSLSSSRREEGPSGQPCCHYLLLGRWCQSLIRKAEQCPRTAWYHLFTRSFLGERSICWHQWQQCCAGSRMLLPTGRQCLSEGSAGPESRGRLLAYGCRFQLCGEYTQLPIQKALLLMLWEIMYIHV